MHVGITEASWWHCLLNCNLFKKSVSFQVSITPVCSDHVCLFLLNFNISIYMTCKSGVSRNVYQDEFNFQIRIFVTHSCFSGNQSYYRQRGSFFNCKCKLDWNSKKSVSLYYPEQWILQANIHSAPAWLTLQEGNKCMCAAGLIAIKKRQLDATLEIGRIPWGW